MTLKKEDSLILSKVFSDCLPDSGDSLVNKADTLSPCGAYMVVGETEN